MAQARHVAKDRGRDLGPHEIGQIQTFFRRLGCQKIEGALDALAQVERLVLQLHLARLDLGKVEDIVDHREQGISALADGLDELVLLRGQVGVQQQAGHADDGIHRRTDLVAHRGQKCALGLTGRLGFAASLACFFLRPCPFGNLALRPIIEPRVFDGDGRLMGQGLEHLQVALVKGVQSVTLGVHHANDPLLRFQRYSQLRSHLAGLRQAVIARLLAHIRHQQRLPTLGYPASDPLLPHLDARRAKLGVLPDGPGPRFEDELVPLDQGNADQIIRQSLFYQAGDFPQQLIRGQKGGHAPPHLADHLELLCSPQLSFKEACVLDSHSRLVGDGLQESPVRFVVHVEAVFVLEDNRAQDSLAPQHGHAEEGSRGHADPFYPQVTNDLPRIVRQQDRPALSEDIAGESGIRNELPRNRIIGTIAEGAPDFVPLLVVQYDDHGLGIHHAPGLLIDQLDNLVHAECG